MTSDAFTAAVVDLRPGLVRYAGNLVRNHADAEDCVQQGVANVWRHLATFRGECSLASFLYVAVHNRALQCLARRARQCQLQGGQMLCLDEPGATVPAPMSCDPRNPVRAAEAANALARLRGRLPRAAARIFAAFDDESMTYETAARDLGIALGTVKSRLHRARAQLARLLRADPIVRECLAA